MAILHLEVVGVVGGAGERGLGVRAACCGIGGFSRARTLDHTKVTCKSCRTTRAWYAADDSLHAYSGNFWRREDGMIGKRMCGAAGHGAGTEKMWEVTCPHCIDAILDCMVAVRVKLKETGRPRTATVPSRSEPTCCGHCDYEEADGSLIAQCKACRRADGVLA